MKPPKRTTSTSQKHPYQDKSRGPRLQKVLAEAGIDSRRHCEQLIEDGRVVVNGKCVRHLPAWVDPTEDRITVDGKPVARPRRSRTGRGETKSARSDSVYIMLNKPRNVVSTNRDPSGRKRAIDLVKPPGNPRLFCVGRLDADSTGLLLLTNDGEMTNRLTHPRYGVHKTYEVVIKGSLNAEAVAKLEEGIFLHDRRGGVAKKTRAVRLALIKRDRDRTHVRMELREGRNRQIRRMMARLGHPVKRLTRVKLGPLKLTGLPSGHWRPLNVGEVRALRRVLEKV